MAVSSHHIAISLFGMLISAGLVIITCLSNWVHSAKISNAAINQKQIQQGLWIKCETLTGSGSMTAQCVELYPSLNLNQLPTYLAFSRCAMIIACVFAVFATVASILGNPCLSLCRAKSKIVTFFTAGMLLLAGLLALISFSWYTNAAMNNYVTRRGEASQVNPMVRSISQWDLGWNMWLGFVTSIFAILGGLYAMYVAAHMNEFPEYTPAKTRQSSSHV